MAVKLKGQGSLCPQQVVSAREREHLEWAFIAEAALLVQTILVERTTLVLAVVAVAAGASTRSCQLLAPRRDSADRNRDLHTLAGNRDCDRSRSRG